jgi:hypothetical protein
VHLVTQLVRRKSLKLTHIFVGGYGSEAGMLSLMKLSSKITERNDMENSISTGRNERLINELTEALQHAEHRLNQLPHNYERTNFALIRRALVHAAKAKPVEAIDCDPMGQPHTANRLQYLENGLTRYQMNLQNAIIFDREGNALAYTHAGENAALVGVWAETSPEWFQLQEYLTGMKIKTTADSVMLVAWDRIKGDHVSINQLF